MSLKLIQPDLPTWSFCIQLTRYTNLWNYIHIPFKIMGTNTFLNCIFKQIMKWSTGLFLVHRKQALISNSNSDMEYRSDKQACIRCWFGTFHCNGSDMTFWLIIQSVHVISRSTSQYITFSDTTNEGCCIQVSKYKATIDTQITDENHCIGSPSHLPFYLQDASTRLDHGIDNILLHEQSKDMIFHQVRQELTGYHITEF
jgi:hypothetical protein